MTSRRDALPAAVDVLVVGGGPAGLGAALTLGRARRSVLVVDAAEPRNAPAAAMHAFLTRDGTAPADFLEAARREVAGYGVVLHTGRVTGVQDHAAGQPSDAADHTTAPADRTTAAAGRFVVEVDGVRTVEARRLVVTTGLVDELPDVAGLAARWGRDVVHCPYCHGWEVRDRRIGVLATSPMSWHQAGLFRQLSDQVLVLRHTGPELDADHAATFAARGIEVVDGEVVEVEVHEDAITGVRLADGRRVALDVLAVAPRFVGRTELLSQLGVPVADLPNDMGSHVPADPMGRTEVDGVWVAGNVTDPSAQVVTAVSQGTRAGAAVNADLVAEDGRLARQRVAV